MSKIGSRQFYSIFGFLKNCSSLFLNNLINFMESTCLLTETPKISVMKNKMKIIILILFLVLQKSIAQSSALVTLDSNGKLVYTPDNKGNIIPDFSGVGYMNSESSIPTIAIVKTVNPVEGDNLANIQNAINEVSGYPLDANGFRGAILFTAGIYNISDSITISASGIVLRGEGFNETGTQFIATKTLQHDLINFIGSSGITYLTSTKKSITDAYVPIGAKEVTVASGHSFGVGDVVLVHRIPNEAWINLLGMNVLSTYDPLVTNWAASSYDVYSQRKVVAVQGNKITLDAPIMDCIDPVYSSGELLKYSDNRIQKCGIENMRILSNYAFDTDENHGWEAVSFDKIYNAWARDLEVYYFGYSAVHINSLASWITVDNCKMLDAKSIIDGGRRYSFNVDGQRNLVQNCTTRRGRHDYVNGSRTCGPNVFYNCTATIQNSDIGPHHRWSTGILFDKIVGNGSQNVQNRLDSGSGHGWSGGQIMFWNCTAGKMILQDPPGDQRNWAIGCKSSTITNVGDWTTESLGVVESKGTFISAIPSLFQKQLNDRLSSLLSVNDNSSFLKKNEITIFPNPANDTIIISGIENFNSKIKIEIYNDAGQFIKRLAVNKKQQSPEYNISDLKNGIYFFRISTLDFKKTIKIIIKK